MNDNGFKSKQAPAGKHRGYIFGVTFLAGFVAAIVLWPTSPPVYQSRAVISVEREDGSKIQQEMFESRLKNASREVLSEESLQNIFGKISTTAQGNKLFEPANRVKLRAAVQIGLATGETKSSRLVSVSLSGEGTADEVEFVNLVGNKLVARLSETNQQFAQAGVADEIRHQFRLSQSRVRGLLNGAELISTQQNKKLGAVNSIEFSETNAGTQEVANPAWEAYRNRLRELIARRSGIESTINGGGDDFEMMLESSAVREEIRVLKSQLANEPEKIQFDFQQVASTAQQKTEASQVIQTDYNSELPDGPSIRHNRFFSQAADQQAGQNRNVQLVSRHEIGTAQTTMEEVNAQIRSEESRQARLQSALVSETVMTQGKAHAEFSRLMKPAIKSHPLGSGVSRGQFIAMLVFSTAFASVVTWSSGSVVSGNKFRTAEEVSRKLRMAVIGVVPVTDKTVSPGELTHSKIVRRTILGCELLLIAFAIIMLVTTVLHSEIFNAMRQDPMTGFMEAVRAIRPW